MLQWLRNIKDAVWTVIQGMWVTLRYWLITYRPDRKTFTDILSIPNCRWPLRPIPGISSLRSDDLHRLRSVRESLPRRLHLHWQRARDRWRQRF